MWQDLNIQFTFEKDIFVKLLGYTCIFKCNSGFGDQYRNLMWITPTIFKTSYNSLLTAMQMQILVDRIVKKRIFMKHKKVGYRTVQQTASNLWSNTRNEPKRLSYSKHWTWATTQSTPHQPVVFQAHISLYKLPKDFPPSFALYSSSESPLTL